MPKLLKTLLATLICLVLLDVAVAGLLTSLAGYGGPVAKLEGFFDYGRSVPGKLREWVVKPKLRGNLFDAGWRSDILRASAARFATEDPSTPECRAYSMSFVNHIMRAAHKLDPGLQLDLHAGPAAPPNFTYALFLDDRPNRRPGDIVVFGILSSSVPALAALSNRTWMFEQPAPFTYPIFLPASNGGLKRIEPLVETADDERAILRDAASPEARAWQHQVQGSDLFYLPEGFALPGLDVSPFVRLVRRSLAVKAIAAETARVLADAEGGPLPYGVILRRMVRSFARIAREDSQTPVVVLVQTHGGADLRTLLAETLKADHIPYLATADLQDPNDPGAYVPDGHYKPGLDTRFAAAFLKLIDKR